MESITATTWGRELLAEPFLDSSHFTKEVISEGEEWPELPLLSITQARAAFSLKLFELAQLLGQLSVDFFLREDQAL